MAPHGAPDFGLGEIKSREVEMGSHRELDNPLLQFFFFVFFLNNSFLDIMTSPQSC